MRPEYINKHVTHIPYSCPHQSILTLKVLIRSISISLNNMRSSILLTTLLTSLAFASAVPGVARNSVTKRDREAVIECLDACAEEAKQRTATLLGTNENGSLDNAQTSFSQAYESNCVSLSHLLRKITLILIRNPRSS